MKTQIWVGLFLTGFGSAACGPPSDIGKVCTLLLPDGGLWKTAQSPTDDFLYQGDTQCENLVCLRPAASNLDAGYGLCSSPCTPRNSADPNSLSDDCNGSSSGLVCRQVSLDPTFIQQIEAEDGGEELLKNYLGGSLNPDYCTTHT